MNIKSKNKKCFTNEQVAMYATVAIHNFKNSGNIEIDEKLFYSYVLSLMELHSPEKIKEIYMKIVQAL